jgi:murein L,D-transpeptidase YcbB/YkuD
MQSSISTVTEFISATTQLFFPPQDRNLVKQQLPRSLRKNLIVSALFFIPYALAQAGPDEATKAPAAASPAATINIDSLTHIPDGMVFGDITKPKPKKVVVKPKIKPPVVTPTTNPTPAATTSQSPAPVVQSVTPPVPDVSVARPTTEIATLVASKQHPYLTRADFSNRLADLDALYKTTNYQPLWLGDASKANQNIAEVIKLLESAAQHGLKTVDYDTLLLQQKLHDLKQPIDIQSNEVAQNDVAISLSVLRFLSDLHYGRVNPREIQHGTIQQRTEKTLDLPALITTNLAQNNLAKLPDLVEPKLPQYQKLKHLLAGNQKVETPTIPTLKLTAKSPVRVGDVLAQSMELQHYLVAIGDLAADKVDNNATTYTDSMAEAVKKFQQRHGIKETGIINKATMTAFNKTVVPVSNVLSEQKITQIELVMERLRWLPEVTEGRTIMVNIPAFQLYAYDDINQDTPTKTMRVVVGKAVGHQTPLLSADMRFVDFQPYWNVPFKIARDEILPKLLNNPGYLSGQNMEVVSRSGKRLGDSDSFAAQIRQGSIGIRQRPGTGNALGKVKFIFPNKSDVYLHDTPSVALFGRARRDLSHGCVRVSQPQKLAEFVLNNEGSWDEDSIKKAMNGRNRRVSLKDSIPVFFLYNTAFFNENNQLEFYSDIYHHDASLLEELKKPRKDLSDKDLFAPKTVVPETDDPSATPIEANRTEPNTGNASMVNTANAKSATPALEATTKPAGSESSLAP